LSASTRLVWYNLCYTNGVKTAISLPEDLFRRAEVAARKLKMSRSQLYATAIAEFIERRQAAKITQRLNEIYSAEPAKIDPAVSSAQSKSIEREPW
jgi:metal-responsive CopG/Arc/MetJ family transcriptional regulator